MRTLIFVFLLPWISIQQSNVPASGQCQAFCLSKYAKSKEYLSLTGESYQDVDVMNNTDFSLCKLGCHSPNFNDLVLPAFKVGQQAFLDIVDGKHAAPLTISPVKSVSLLCVDNHPNASFFARLVLDMMPNSDSVVHYIEAVKRDDNDHLEAILWNVWSYSPIVEFSSSMLSSNESIQFRVLSFNKEGLMGQLVKSMWIGDEELRDLRPLDVVVEKKVWKDESASAILRFNNNRGPSVCTVLLVYQTHTNHQQSLEFVMDRSRGYLLEKLTFDHLYNLRLSPLGVDNVNATTVVLTVPPCLQLVNEPTMCAPPPVDKLDWKWKKATQDGHMLILSWTYGSIKEDEMKSLVSTMPMVHFDLEVSAMKTDEQPQCEHLDVLRRVVTWTHRSAVMYVQDDRCNYEVNLTVVDSKNRKSPVTSHQILKYEDRKGVLALSTAEWNVEMMLLVVFVLAILMVAGGMAICRVRDRTEFNTLKREHRQLTKSIVVAQAASTLPRSNQCLTIVDGRGRPISSDPSELSAHLENVKGCHPYFADEGVYDSLDTPTRSEVSYVDRLSSSSLSRANPIYSGINVHGVKTIPMDQLHISQFGHFANKPWTSANSVDKTNGSAYMMKYSHDESTALRHELGIVTRISTDHPNLLLFCGLASRDNQVLGALFEPIRGGTLHGFLAEARCTLFERGDGTRSSTSSGYDGSDKSQDSLDRFQQRIDRLTGHMYNFARNIASALNFLHLQNCCHGNVNTEAVYLMKSYKDPLKLPCDQVAKLGDYDNTIHGTPVNGLTPLTISPSLIPPEVLEGKSFSTAGDMWQYGLLLCEMVTLGVSPSLWEACEGSITEKTVKNYYSRLSTGHDTYIKIDPGMVQLKQKITKCLLLEPKRRATAKEIEKELLELQPQHEYREHMESVEV